MKNTLLLTLILVFSCSTFANNDVAPGRGIKLLQFMAKNAKNRNFALSNIIAHRCGRYLNGSAVKECKRAVKKQVEILDFDVIFLETKNLQMTPGPFVFVAFKQDFIKLLHAQSTETYLESLNQKLNEYLLGNESLNIWEHALAHFGSPFKASEAIAILFQDTTPMKLHLGYLEASHTRGSALYESNKALLDRTLDELQMILNIENLDHQKLFYPSDIKAKFNRGLYHFYVPFYLALNLKKQGMSSQQSLTAPFLLTLSYEFVTSAEDYRYFFSDPKTINDEYKLRDIFAGYSGASYALQGSKVATSFEILRKGFARSTEETIQGLLK